MRLSPRAVGRKAILVSDPYRSNSLRVSRVKRRLFGSNEESISIGQVASVKISTGVLWSDILIESTGGSDPITSHGHRKADALRIRDLVEGFQAARR